MPGPGVEESHQKLIVPLCFPVPFDMPSTPNGKSRSNEAWRENRLGRQPLARPRRRSQRGLQLITLGPLATLGGLGGLGGRGAWLGLGLGVG